MINLLKSKSILMYLLLYIYNYRLNILQMRVAQPIHRQFFHSIEISQCFCDIFKTE